MKFFGKLSVSLDVRFIKVRKEYKSLKNARLLNFCNETDKNQSNATLTLMAVNVGLRPIQEG